MKKFFYNEPFFRLLWPALYGAVVYLLILLLNNTLDQLKESFFGQELYFCIGLSYLVFEVTRLLLIYRSKKDLDKDPNLLNSLNLVLINVAISAIVVGILVNIYFRTFLGFSSLSTFSAELVIFLTIYSLTGLFYTSLAISTQYLFRENLNQLQQEQILTENLELELVKFKNEINPNLLYDSLESLISLIHKNAEEAEDYIDKMALVYRYILSNRNTELVKIDEELQATKNVVILLNEMHNNNIELQNGLQDQVLEEMVIPGSLTSIMESIIRKTIISDTQPLKIQLEVDENGYLVVSHTLNDKLRLDGTESLQQLQRAYSIFTEKPVVSVKAYGESFIKIPLLQLKEEVPE